MNVSKITIYSAASKANMGALPFKGDVKGNSKAKAGEMLESFAKPVTDYEVTHLDLPGYGKCRKQGFMDKLLSRDPEFDTMVENSSFERLEKSNKAADTVIGYTLQQIKDGNAFADSTLKYKGVDTTKEINVMFRNGISVSLVYNLMAAERPNIVTVTARSGDKQTILLYNNGMQRSEKVEKLIEVLKLV